MSKQLPLNPPEQKKNLLGRHKTLFTVVGIALVAAIILSVILVPGAIEQYRIKKQEQTAVGTCAGYDIPYEELRFVAYNYRKHLEQKYGSDIWNSAVTATKYAEELETLVTENLNTTYAVYALCEHLNVPLNSSDVNDYVKKKMKELKESEDFGGSKKAFNEWLKENYMTEHLLEQTLKSAYLESMALNAMIEAKQYITYSYDNLSEFLNYVEHSEDYARTLHVYIANAKGENVPSDKTLARAQEICDALRGETTLTERFNRLCEFIRTDSNDYQMTTTDGYYFTKNEMDAAYEKATFDLAIGDVSDPLVTDDGVYVIMRLAPEASYIMTKYATLLDNYQAARLGAMIETFRKQNPAVLNEYGKSLALWALE